MYESSSTLIRTWTELRRRNTEEREDGVKSVVMPTVGRLVCFTAEDALRQAPQRSHLEGANRGCEAQGSPENRISTFARYTYHKPAPGGFEAPDRLVQTQFAECGDATCSSASVDDSVFRTVSTESWKHRLQHTSRTSKYSIFFGWFAMPVRKDLFVNLKYVPSAHFVPS